MDFALAEEPDGTIMLHRVDYPRARELSRRGYPVASLFGCAGPLPAEIKRHECLLAASG